MLCGHQASEQAEAIPTRPRKSYSNLIFAGFVLVSGPKQRSLLPEPRLSIPEHGLSEGAPKGGHFWLPLRPGHTFLILSPSADSILAPLRLGISLKPFLDSH